MKVLTASLLIIMACAFSSILPVLEETLPDGVERMTAGESEGVLDQMLGNEEKTPFIIVAAHSMNDFSSRIIRSLVSERDNFHVNEKTTEMPATKFMLSKMRLAFVLRISGVLLFIFPMVFSATSRKEYAYAYLSGTMVFVSAWFAGVL